MGFTWNLETKKRLKATYKGNHYKTVNIEHERSKKDGDIGMSVPKANEWIKDKIKRAMQKNPNNIYQVSFYDSNYSHPFSTDFIDNYNEFLGVQTMSNKSGSDVPENEISVSMIKVNTLKLPPKKLPPKK